MLTLLFFDLDMEVHSTLIQITNATKLGDNMNSQRKQTDDEKEIQSKIMFTLLNTILTTHKRNIQTLIYSIE